MLAHVSHMANSPDNRKKTAVQEIRILQVNSDSHSGKQPETANISERQTSLLKNPRAKTMDSQKNMSSKEEQYEQTQRLQSSPSPTTAKLP